MRVRAAVIGGAALCLLAPTLACARAAPRSAPGSCVESVADGQYVMGTVLELTLVAGCGRRAAARAAIDGAFGTARELDALLSRFDPGSEISRLNASAGGEPVRVDRRTAGLLELARASAVATRGAFDVTVGPLVDAWTRAAEQGALPRDDEIAAALARVGSDGIRTLPGDRVALTRPRMSVDLGGIAKGFALDEIRRGLLAAGFRSGLLSFGQSSVWALGSPPDARAWRLLLKAPVRGFAGVVELRDQALSISSTLSQWTEIGGVRYGHVVDPRTGRAATEIREAVVVASTAAAAESLSTALLVLEPEEGLELVEARGAEALLLNAEGEGMCTRGWQKETGWEAPGPPPDGSLRAGS